MIKFLSRFVSVLAVVAFLFLCFGLLVGCAHTLPGLSREAAIYDGSTNAVAFISRYVAPLVPAPWNGVVPLALGAAGAALGAWNLSQEKRLAALKGSAAPIK